MRSPYKPAFFAKLYRGKTTHVDIQQRWKHRARELFNRAFPTIYLADEKWDISLDKVSNLNFPQKTTR